MIKILINWEISNMNQEDKNKDKEITDSEKLNYIVENQSIITTAIMKGHKSNDKDEFQDARIKIKQYRKELGLIWKEY